MNGRKRRILVSILVLMILTIPVVWSETSFTESESSDSRPKIQNVTVLPKEAGGFVNVSAVVTDDVDVFGVWIELGNPSLDPLGNFSMSLDPNSGRYFHNSTLENSGTHTCTIRANDTSNNWNAEVCSFTLQEPTPTGWLRADGKYIVNEFGQKVFLRGAALGDLSWRTRWAGDIGYRVDQLSNLTNGKANVIRVALTPNPKTTWPGEPYPWTATLVDPSNNIWQTEIHPEVYDEEVDQVVAEAARNDMVIFVEFHGGFCSPSNVPRYGGDCTGENSYTSALALDPTPYINWHLHWINRYRDNPTVAGVELWNEPWDAAFGYGNRDLGRARFMNMEIQAVQAIDQANPKALTIVASAPYASIMQEWIDNPLPYNVMYGWDTYYKHWSDYWKKEYAAGDWEGGYNKTYEKLYKYNIGKAAVDAGLPVIACEFGWRGDEQLEPGWEHQMADFLSIINEWETHWYIWWWWDSSNMGLANTGYTSLRPYGEIWAQAL